MTQRTDDAKRLVREFHRRILTEHDLEAADELLAPGYVEHNPVLPDGAIHGREKMVAFWSEMFEGVSDLAITEEEIVTTGDRVVTRHVGAGVHDGHFLGLEPTGNRFEIDGMDLYHVEDGRLAEGWVVIDALGMMQQLGALPEDRPAR